MGDNWGISRINIIFISIITIYYIKNMTPSFPPNSILMESHKVEKSLNLKGLSFFYVSYNLLDLLQA